MKVFSQNDDDNRRYALIVPQIALTETAKSYRIGYYYSSELSSAGIALLISSKTIQFGDSYLNGVQVNNLNFEIFYR